MINFTDKDFFNIGWKSSKANANLTATLDKHNVEENSSAYFEVVSGVEAAERDTKNNG